MKRPSRFVKGILTLSIVVLSMYLVFDVFVPYVKFNDFRGYLTAIPLIVIFYNLLYLLDVLFYFIYGVIIPKEHIQELRDTVLIKKGNFLYDLLGLRWKLYYILFEDKRRVIRQLVFKKGHYKNDKKYVYFSIITNKYAILSASKLLMYVLIIMINMFCIKLIIPFTI